MDEYVRLSKSTIHEATKRLVSLILHTFEGIHLRAPTHEDMQRIMAHNTQRGLPGCIGSLDGSHWAWTYCPTAHAVMYKGRHRTPNNVLETIWDEDPWVWHFFAGSFESKNDINELSHSPFMVKVTPEDLPPPGLTYTVNGEEMSLPHYLVGGIYPRYSIFVAPHSRPVTTHGKAFNQVQEGMRIYVERFYAVLTSRIHVALHPACA